MSIADTKALTRHLVGIVKCAKRAAAICGVSEMTISRWGNDTHRESIPFHHLKQLDAAAGDLALKEWARERGYDLVSSVKPEEVTVCITKTFGQFSKEAGELGFTVLDAVADNHVTPAEKRRIRDDIRPVKDAIAQLERALA